MVTPPTAERSKLMARVRQRGTAPELAVRSILDRQGHDYETNGSELPGSPDLYDRYTKRALFVHGCYWHRHRGCRATTTPTSNRDFWVQKFEQNVARDRRKVRTLRRMGYRVLTVWECQLKSPKKLARLERRLDAFFGKGA
jgi:DNA mismatch endonuclease, patch repair protein